MRCRRRRAGCRRERLRRPPGGRHPVGSVAGIPRPRAGASAHIGLAAAATGLQHLLPASAAEIHAILGAAADIAITTKFLRYVGVVVTHALAMR